MTAAVQVRGLQRRYGAIEALRGVDLEVAPGEIVAVLGPNGAGKTTLMEILEGFRNRDAGEVRVLGTDPSGAPRALRQRLGIVLQECPVPPYLSVREVLAMCARYYPSPRAVDEVVELVGLGETSGTRVLRLSGGQRRRLDLALALVGDPEMLFLDEPTTGFDPSARRQAWELVRGMGAQGRTVLLTTHFMDEAQALADRIVVVSGGRVVADGDAATIGGRDESDARISFRLPTGIAAADLPLPAASAVDGDTVRLTTATPTAVLAALCAAASARGVELPGLRVERSSLEDIYLRLTGEDSP